MKNIKFIIAIIATIVFLNSCDNKSSDNGEETEEHHDEHENTSTAKLSIDQIKSINIEFGNIEKKQLTASLKANGLLKVPNQNKATITTYYAGVVKTILVQPGSGVKKGQIIATISNPSFITMQEEFLNISARSELAQTEFDRQKTLKEGNASALKTYQQAETELKTLMARKTSLQKQLELIGINTTALTNENMQSAISITSPIAGSVSHVMVNIGSYSEANNPIAEIVDNSQLHLDLFVYEKDLAKLKVGQTIHFTVTNNAGREYDAKVFGISNTFEPNTKAIAVHASVIGDKTNLIDGMSITALVSLENALLDAVPTDAIVSHEGQDFIFIVTDAHSEEEHHAEADREKHDEHGHKHEEETKTETKEGSVTFEKIPVKKGTTDVGYSEITLLKEIPANAKIVTSGAFFILAKMTNQGEAHEH